jgi:hypothetical protein
LAKVKRIELLLADLESAVIPFHYTPITVAGTIGLEPILYATKKRCITIMLRSITSNWRTVRDSNPRKVALRRFSKPVLSTTQPTVLI